MKHWYPTITVAALLLNGCGASPNPMTLTPAYQDGKADGCRTAQGEYTKDHTRFQTDTAYHEGWFAGRKACNPTN